MRRRLLTVERSDARGSPHLKMISELDFAPQHLDVTFLICSHTEAVQGEPPKGIHGQRHLPTPQRLPRGPKRGAVAGVLDLSTARLAKLISEQ
jgi:hypothetical protein